jgi:hypothetical protein
MRTIATTAARLGGVLLMLLGAAALCRAALDGADRLLAGPSPPLVQADFPLCVNVKPPPLLREPEGRLDYRPGQGFNDKGIS